jgi:SAM-dependent methyltransferase
MSMSKQQMDRSWMQRAAEGRLLYKPPSEDITRLAAVGFMKGINGLILDLGSGEGRLELLLDRGNVVGLDESLTLLKYARENIKSSVIFNAIAGNLFLMPFRQQSFAVVVCLNTLENYPPVYVSKMLDQMLLLLKQDGRLIISYRGGAGLKMKLMEWQGKLTGQQLHQYRYNPQKLKNHLGCSYSARIIPLLRQPKGWRKWLGTPADARALLIVDKVR